MVRTFSRSITFWILIFALSLGLRYWYSSTEICFYTDQSRDAVVANKILHGDWQLFGPVVNGRGAIFHGVLYYYVIAPLYALGGGDPWFVSIALSLFSTVCLIPSFLFAKKLFNAPKLAYIVVGLIAVSLSSIETSASFWNLQLSIILLPTYCFFLFKTFEKPTVVNGLVTGLLIGLLVQSGFSNIQWLLPYVVVLGMALYRQRDKKSVFTTVILSLCGFACAISSMLLVEYLAWKRGLFAMQDSLHWVSTGAFSVHNIQSVGRWYFDSLTSFLVPQFPWVTAALLLLSAVTVYITRQDKRWKWLGLLLIPPVLGQLASDSAASYILTGYESIFYIGIVLVFYKCLTFFGKNFSQHVPNAITMTLLILFAFSNLAAIQLDKTTNDTLACAWKTGSFEELQAIEYTYQLAEGKPFTIDTVTEPYGINLKYGYLYAWYGQKKYGYTPAFIGKPQAGYISEGLLRESDQYLPLHFAIYEHGSYNYWFHIRTAAAPATQESQELFYYRQPPINALQDSKKFGELITVDRYLSK